MTRFAPLTSRPPPSRALIIGDTAEARARAAAAALLAGVAGEPGRDVAGGLARLNEKPVPAFVLVEIDGEDHDHPDLVELLLKLGGEAAEGRYACVVSTPAALIDLVAALAPHSRVAQLADAADADRVAAIADAARPCPARVRDTSGAHADSVRLRALTDEVGRIAGALARLSALGSSPAPSQGVSVPAGDDLADLRRTIRARRLRGRHMEPALFADPAWDMLLDLAAARIEERTVAVSSLCIAAAVPATTALRWIKLLTDAGLFARRADPTDGRRVFIELSDAAAAAMHAYLADVRRLD